MAVPGRPEDFDPDRIFGALCAHGVAFVVIGGIARVLHGSAQATGGSDVLVARDVANLKKLAAALGDLDARLMAGREALDFGADLDRLRRGLNFSWMTTAGQVDVFGEVEGGLRYPEVAKDAIEVVTAGGNVIRVASIDRLLDMKRRLTRPKDVRDVEELEQLKTLGTEPPIA
jgi:hypothetical protein